MFDFKDKIVVVTGGAGGIGKCISEQFKMSGAKVCVIDINENEYFVGDVSDKKVRYGLWQIMQEINIKIDSGRKDKKQ